MIPEMSNRFPLCHGRHHLFCEKVLQRRVVQHGIRQKALELRVLVLERPQPLRLRNFHGALLRLPVVDRRLGYAVPPRQICGDVSPSLLQHPDNLLFRKPLALHLVRPRLGRTLIATGGNYPWQVRWGRNAAYDPAGLKHRIKEIAETRVRYGYRRITALLKREGWPVNGKKIYRLYR